MIRNCTVLVLRREDTLDAGVRVQGQGMDSMLYRGVAYISAPARGWQQASALEGVLDATLMIHSSDDLASAAVVQLTNKRGSSEYEVLAARVTGNEHTLTLRKRAVTRRAN